MSIVDSVVLTIQSPEEMADCGLSLAKSIYQKPLNILFEGELGAGKTTFIKGFARGLGITETVTSPSFALEQHYGDILTHIDLYRLNRLQATEFMQHRDEDSRIRVIEWGSRDTSLTHDIKIMIDEIGQGKRRLSCTFMDIKVPTDDQIKEWICAVRLPVHIVRHMDQVTTVADRVCDHLLSQGRIVRKSAVHAAAKAHDLLRYVDFKSWTADSQYASTEEERAVWTSIKETYGTPHEHAVQRFMKEKGFSTLGDIISTHRGSCDDPKGAENVWTIEQMVVAYADKRMLFDTPVTLEERFDDLCKRYGNNTENAERQAWRKTMKDVERFLFDGPPTF